MLVADFEGTNVSRMLESSSVAMFLLHLPTICLFENSLQLLNPVVTGSGKLSHTFSWICELLSTKQNLFEIISVRFCFSGDCC